MSGRKKAVLAAAGILVVLLAGMGFTVTDGLGEAVAVPVGHVRPAGMADGIYSGSYDFKRWSTSVDVHIKSGRIEAVDIVGDVRAAAVTDCAGEMIGRVIEAQDTAVDTVSGATATCKAYLKAIEDALN